MVQEPTILDLHPTVNMSAEYLCAQGVDFLQTISRGYIFRTVKHLSKYGKKYNKTEMESGIKKCIDGYYTWVLKLTQFNTDNKCLRIEDRIRLVRLNVWVTEENVREIERSIRTVKESIRYHVHCGRRLPLL